MMFYICTNKENTCFSNERKYFSIDPVFLLEELGNASLRLRSFSSSSLTHSLFPGIELFVPAVLPWGGTGLDTCPFKSDAWQFRRCLCPRLLGQPFHFACHAVRNTPVGFSPFFQFFYKFALLFLVLFQ